MKPSIAASLIGLILTAGVAFGHPDETCSPSSCSTADAPSNRGLNLPADTHPPPPPPPPRLHPAPRPGSGSLDRRLFDLAAMSPGYFKVLGREPVYLDIPATE